MWVTRACSISCSRARQNKALVCVHAENHGMISWMGKRLVEKGYTAPKYHTISHPRGCEAEAFPASSPSPSSSTSRS